MRKPVFPRIIFIALLYCCVFVFLVSVQFANRGGFSEKVGNFTVTGRSMTAGEEAGEYLVSGDIHVLYGFFLADYHRIHFNL